MQRTTVHVVQIRLADVIVGDVLNNEPDARTGWFTVDEIRRLPNGDLNATGDQGRSSVMGADLNIVGVQFTKNVEAPAPDMSKVVLPAPA